MKKSIFALNIIEGRAYFVANIDNVIEDRQYPMLSSPLFRGIKLVLATKITDSTWYVDENPNMNLTLSSEQPQYIKYTISLSHEVN